MGSSASVQVHPSKLVIRTSDNLCGCRKFVRIDNLVAEISKRQPESVTDLVQKLRKVANGRLDLIRSIYTWITNNIIYDEDLLDSHDDISAVDIIETGRSNSLGFSLLLMEMCKENNIECRQVRGYLKNDFFKDLSESTSSPNHYWNHVLMEDSWRIIDCSCGAKSSSKSDLRVLKRASGFYFLTKPEHFIVSHFPSDDEGGILQLLEKPVDLHSFQKSVVLTEEAMTCGIVPVSHKEANITVHRETEVIVKDSKLVLTQFKVDLMCRSIDLGDLKNYTFVKMEDRGIFAVRIRFPLIGMYDLTLTGRVNTGHDITITTYTVTCNKVHPNPQPFPMWRPLWGIHPRLYEFGFEEKANISAKLTITSGEMECQLPVKQRLSNVKPKLSSTQGEICDFVSLISKDDYVTVLARFPSPGHYCLELYCSNGKGDIVIYPVMASFIECKTPLIPCEKFELVENDIWV